VREEPRKATPETGTCLVCGQVFPTQEELSKHLITILLNQGQVHHSCAVETGRPPESASGCHLLVERSCQ
jgi:hypothetical protein